MSDGGKGSKPRPISVAQDEYNKRWDAIFARDLQQENVVVASQLENERLELYKKSDSETEKVSRYNKETQEVKK